MDQDQPLFFSFDYPPMGGGVARLCSEIVMQSHNHEGIRFRVLTGQSPRPWRELMALKTLATMGRVNYCFCGLWYPEGLLATLANIRPRIILAHGSELMPTRQRWRRGLWKHMQSWVLNNADLVIANSRFTADLVKAAAPRSKVAAIPLAVDPELFSPGSMAGARAKLALPDKFIISTVSRLHEYKGIDTVLRALALLPAGLRERFHYVLVGTGPDRARLENLALELGVESAVQWLGLIDDRSLCDVYRASNLFVLCTRENLNQREVEGFGLVFLEAQACGTPVIGARSGGIPDAVSDGNGGWLVKPDDPADLARKFEELALRPEILERQRVLARERVLASCTWRSYITTMFGALKAHGVLRG